MCVSRNRLISIYKNIWKKITKVTAKSWKCLPLGSWEGWDKEHVSFVRSQVELTKYTKLQVQNMKLALRTFARVTWFQGFPEDLTSDQGPEARVWQGAFQAEGTETAQASKAQGREHSVWAPGAHPQVEVGL